MKASVLSVLAGLALLSRGDLLAQSVVEFNAADYGAVPNDDLDDRAAIQAALNSAATLGGGTVRLDSGVFHVLVVYERGLGPVDGFSGGMTGYHGLVVPVNCTLTGAGMENTTVRVLAGTANAETVGDGIVNGGYHMAVTDFGAGGNIRISHLRVDTPDTTLGPTANLIGVAHADGVVLSSVALGSSKAHGLEINRSRNVVVEDCVFDGQHPGVSTLQLDIGYFGAKSLRPTGTLLSDILVRRCQFRGRASETGGGKIIELGHTSSACILRNIAFEDCTMESLLHPSTVCVSNDNPAAQEISGLRFERCHFIGLQEAPSVNGLLQLTLQGTQLLHDLTVRDCTFSGAFSQGVVVISTTPFHNTGHSHRRRILLEGNVFEPTFDRSVPYSADTFLMLAAAACSELTIRRNLFHFPATAVNLTVFGRIRAIQAAHSLDTKIEDNVFTWAHASQATAPILPARLSGIYAPVYLLEQNGIKARMQVTGNVFLHPANGIGTAINMTTAVSTIQWAAGGPWVGGLIAGNYSSGAGSAPVWNIHHDLSSTGNIGQVLPPDPSRTVTAGWYPCNGATLTSLDSDLNALPRVNAEKCGYTGNLPTQPGTVVRLRGPLTGEGLLAPLLDRYAGSVYQGTDDTLSGLISHPVADLTNGSLRVVRAPLTVYRWEASLSEGAAPFGSWAPADKPIDSPGFWVPFNTFVDSLADNADLDGDGRNNLFERAFLSDPAVADGDPLIDLTSDSGGVRTVNFRCASGPHSPRICLLRSFDLSQWEVESSCPAGGLFEAPAAGSLNESQFLTGREIRFTSPPTNRRFWRVSVEP